MSLTLVLGGARSGKSAYAQNAAEREASARGVSPKIIVTAEIFDEEMAQRVALHRQDRGDWWTTIEAPRDLASAIRALKSDDVVVIDCMTLWLSNIMLAEVDIASETQRLLNALEQTSASIWIVTNEVGWSIVPDNALARRYRDEAGRLNQILARYCRDVFLIAAGMKLRLEATEY